MDDNKVADLIEDLMSQFRTFGEGLQMLNEKVENGFVDINTRIDRLEENNRREHQQLIQMIQELDTEVVQLKRVK